MLTNKMKNIIKLFLVLLQVFTIFGQLQDECVNSHNKYRDLHVDTNSVVWDTGLATAAQQWADHLRDTGSFAHDSGDFGENLYWMSNQKQATCEDAVTSWYNEINDYDYATGKSKNSNAIGHFTQVVWRATTNIGVGVATKVANNGNTETYIVARYTPKGNFLLLNIGETLDDARIRIYTEQVAALKGDSATTTTTTTTPTTTTTTTTTTTEAPIEPTTPEIVTTGETIDTTFEATTSTTTTTTTTTTAATTTTAPGVIIETDCNLSEILPKYSQKLNRINRVKCKIGRMGWNRRRVSVNTDFSLSAKNKTRRGTFYSNWINAPDSCNSTEKINHCVEVKYLKEQDSKQQIRIFVKNIGGKPVKARLPIEKADGNWKTARISLDVNCAKTRFMFNLRGSGLRVSSLKLSRGGNCDGTTTSNQQKRDEFNFASVEHEKVDAEIEMDMMNELKDISALKNKMKMKKQ